MIGFFRTGRRMMHALKHWLVAASLLASAAAGAWSDHASLSWPLLRTMPALLETTVEAESLGAFVAAEASGLERLLAGHEALSRQTLPWYAPRPDALAFSADAANPRLAFLRAIRVNPTLPYTLYRQLTVEEPPERGPDLTFGDLSFLGPGVSHRETGYLALAPGAALAPAHVLASASDEPDFGMDVGLFEDNGTDFGESYGFGRQPFGNPNLPYGSQAPFHMGFYHLDWLTRRAQPGLLRTYPDWRVSLYRALARFAFASGHDYWGWRFTGWALHYIGDLTQPYHADPLPGVSTISALWAVARGRTDDLVQLVSNRHGVLESYQYQRVRAAQERRDWDATVLAAVAGGGPAAVYSEHTLHQALTAESVAAGPALDRALTTWMPALFVSDPGFEWSGSGEEAAVVDAVAQRNGAAAVTALDTVLAAQLRRFSRYSRAWIALASGGLRE
jgi:hypothetical protein